LASHLKAWLARFPETPRRSLTTEQVELAIAAWRSDDVAARTIRHRCRALKSLFFRLDGPLAFTPLDGVKLPPKPKPRPVSIADATIKAVALKLVEHEQSGLLRDAKTRARFLVLATTGRRPAEVQRTEPGDVDFARRLWVTRTAKGGPHNELLLHREAIAAWQLFAQAQAWGEYDTRSFVRVLHHCGWPKTIRPYNLRHSTARALRVRGADAADVQAQLGHASIVTGARVLFRYDTRATGTAQRRPR
jgi:integrase